MCIYVCWFSSGCHTLCKKSDNIITVCVEYRKCLILILIIYKFRWFWCQAAVKYKTIACRQDKRRKKNILFAAVCTFIVIDYCINQSQNINIPKWSEFWRRVFYCMWHSGLWPGYSLRGGRGRWLFWVDKTRPRSAEVAAMWIPNKSASLSLAGFQANCWYPRVMGKRSTFLLYNVLRRFLSLNIERVTRGDHTLTQSQSDWQAALLCSPVTQTSAPTMAEIPLCLFG